MDKEVSFTNKEMGIIVSVTISSILPLLDGSIINVIMPALAKDFSVPQSQIQWVVTAYFLSSISGLLFSSWLQGKMGLKKAWFLSSVIFLLGSLYAGLSYDFNNMIISRVIQGVAAGIILPMSQIIIAIEFGKQRMKAAMGLVAVPAVFAPALGPLFGALFSEYISWRFLFLINIPLIFLSLWSGVKNLSSYQPTGGRFNFVLFVLFSVTLCLFFFFTDQIKKEINTTGLIQVALSVVLLVIAIGFNGWAKNKLIEFREFKKINYSIAMFMGLLVSFLFYSFMIFYPLATSLHDHEGDRLLESGILLGLQGVGAWVGRKYLYQKISHRSPFFIIVLGVFISTLSLPLFQYNVVLSAAGFIIRGVGLGIATISCLAAPLQWAEAEYIKDTSVITRLLQQLGGAIGGIFSGMLIYSVISWGVSLPDAYMIFFSISSLLSIVMLLLFIGLSQKETA